MIDDGYFREAPRTPYAHARNFPSPPNWLQRRWNRWTQSAQRRLERALENQCLTTLEDALLDGAQPNQPAFDDGCTALHEAARVGWLGGIEALLAAGADASRSSSDGLSVVRRAAPYGMALVNRLIEAGAPLEAGDIDDVHRSLPSQERDRGAWKLWAQDFVLERSLPPVAAGQRPRL